MHHGDESHAVAVVDVGEALHLTVREARVRREEAQVDGVRRQAGVSLQRCDVVPDTSSADHEKRRDELRSEAGSTGTFKHLILAFDDYELLRQDDDFMDIEMRLARIARRGSTVGMHLLVCGSNIESSLSWAGTASPWSTRRRA